MGQTFYLKVPEDLFLVCHSRSAPEGDAWLVQETGGPPGPRSRSKHSLAPIRLYACDVRFFSIFAGYSRL